MVFSFNLQIIIWKVNGCIDCGFIKTSKNNKRTGWNYSDWEKAANISKNFDSYKVYIIECFNTEERFLKIGKTFLTVKRRYRLKSSLPYSYNIVKEYIFQFATDASQYETELQNKFKAYQYSPRISFSGKYECFTPEILEILNDNWQIIIGYRWRLFSFFSCICCCR